MSVIMKAHIDQNSDVYLESDKIKQSIDCN